MTSRAFLPLSMIVPPEILRLVTTEQRDLGAVEHAQQFGVALAQAGHLDGLSMGVAADLTPIAGEVLLDQSMLTGESIPIEAGAGVQTFAGGLVRRGEAVATSNCAFQLAIGFG